MTRRGGRRARPSEPSGSRRPALGAAPRGAVLRQGPRHHEGRADDVRHPSVRRQRADRGRADGGPPEGGRRHHGRQDQHADDRAGWARPTTCSSGATRNPWRLDRTPGGSSGGASAAVAAGLAPIAVGTDGGGSIRIPASFAGIFGHKPSYGRIPTYPASAAWSLSHIGPMTRTVADAALAMQVCAGPDERDPYSLPAERGELRPGDPAAASRASGSPMRRTWGT